LFSETPLRRVPWADFDELRQVTYPPLPTTVFFTQNTNRGTLYVLELRRRRRHPLTKEDVMHVARTGLTLAIVPWAAMVLMFVIRPG